MTQLQKMKMSSEIEVVEEVGQSQIHHSENGVVVADECLRNDVYTAAAYEDLVMLQRLVECDGCSVSDPDCLGYYALQWAALNNRTAAAQYIIEGNARRLLEKRCDGNTPLGKFSKPGLAPVLRCLILGLLVTYTHSVIMASNLPKLTAGFGLFAWLGFFLASGGLVMFYRCSRKDPSFIRMSVHDPQNMKDDKNKWEPFLFLLLEVSSILVTGAVAMTRLLSDPVAPSSFGAWISHASTHHVSAISFLIVDFFLIIGVAVLTAVQASQVNGGIKWF